MKKKAERAENSIYSGAVGVDGVGWGRVGDGGER